MVITVKAYFLSVTISFTDKSEMCLHSRNTNVDFGCMSQMNRSLVQAQEKGVKKNN